MPVEAVAVVFPGVNQVELREIALPDPAEDEALVRVEYTGVSVGTERWALEGYRPETVHPAVTGYLGYGVVEAAGQRCERLRPGHRVHFMRSRLPEPYDRNWMGAHLSRAVVKEAALMPPDLPGPAAALVGLAAVSMRGTRRMRVALGQPALVTGQGMIGQAAAQILRARGAWVLTADTMPLRVRLSQQWSADQAINVAEQDLVAAAREFSPEGLDLIVDTTGSNAVVNQLWPLLRTEGQILLQGYYPEGTSFDFHSVHGYRPEILVTSGHSLEDCALAGKLEHAGRLHLEPLITHLLPYTEAPRAYLELLHEGREEFLGVVFDWRGI